MEDRSLNSKIFKRAQRYLVGGVSSPVRAFNYVGRLPVIIKKGIGSKVYDYDGNEYIDYVNSWGSLILGHAPKAVIKDLRQAIELGLSFGTTNKPEIELAQLIKETVSSIEKIRFVSSGTEAIMSAVRVARGYTGRDKIVKFNNSYHGHADYLLARAGSGLATLRIPTSKGVPKDFIKHTIVIPFGDKRLLDKIFRKHGQKIAAILFEPIGGNYGVIPPDTGYLKYLRKLTKEYGSLLISDEVITGLRFNYRIFCEEIGIRPDVVCLGKIIGGGLPIGAYGGSKRIMDELSPIGEVYQASTFSGNPIVMQAGLSTLKVLANKNYRALDDLTEYLIEALRTEAKINNISLKISYFGSMFSLKFKDKAEFQEFYKNMLKLGIYFAPSEFEANFLSFAHSKKDIQKTIEAAKKAFNKLKDK